MNGIGGIGHNNQISSNGRTTHPHGIPEPDTTPSDETPAVIVTLSDEGQAAIGATLSGVDEPTGPGKSAQSPAHLARAALADFASLGEMNFGQIVSTLVKGLGLESLLPEPEVMTTEEATDGTEEASGAEGTEPLAMVVPQDPEAPVEEPADPALSAAQLALDLLTAPDEEEEDALLDLLTPEEST